MTEIRTRPPLVLTRLWDDLLLTEVARRIGGLPCIIAVLNQIAPRPRPPRRRRDARP
jgi:hypothetical protein